MRSAHVSRVISAAPDEVYDFARTPENLPRWAAGLAQSAVRRVGDALIVDSPMGVVTVTFAATNAHGIVDHDVRLPTGEVVNNPVRIIAHPDGTEIVFTVRQRDLSDAEFARDVRAVEANLETLKRLLESPRHDG